MFDIKKKKKEDDLTFLERAYTAILKKQPNSFLYLPLASVYYRKGNLEKAIKTLQKSISTHPNYISAKYYLALLYRKNGEFDKAVEIFKKVTFDSPDNYAAHKALMEYYMEKKDEKNALMELDELARLAPNDERIRDQINRLEQITAPLIPLNKGGLKGGVKTSSNGTPHGVSHRGKKMLQSNSIKRQAAACLRATHRQATKRSCRSGEQTKNSSQKEKLLQSNSIKKSEKAPEQLKEKKEGKKVQKLPLIETNNEVKKNKAKDEMICSLQKWLKNIDKVNHKAASCRLSACDAQAGNQKGLP